MFKKIFSFFIKSEVTTDSKDIQKISEDFVDNMKNSLDKMKEDYFNPENYPLYQREYYTLSRELNNYNSKEELDIFYQKINEIFDNVKKLYDTTDLEEKEQSLLYYDNTKTLNFCFFESYYKLLRSVWNKYKKMKDFDKAFEIFWYIVWGAIQDVKNMPELFDTMRVTDIRFLIKEYWKRWNVDMQESMKVLEEEIGTISRKKQLKELHEQLYESLKRGLERYENFKNSLPEWIVWWKRSITQWYNGCYEKCDKNTEVWWILAHEKFPSWHMYPPFHKEIDPENGIWPCNCYVEYSMVNPETWNLFDK